VQKDQKSERVKDWKNKRIKMCKKNPRSWESLNTLRCHIHHLFLLHHNHTSQGPCSGHKYKSRGALHSQTLSQILFFVRAKFELTDMHI
jgi:hypothetical protein